MINILIILALLLPQRSVNTTRSEIYSKVVKGHAELVSIKASELNKIGKEADLFSYMRDKCWVIDITKLSPDRHWYAYEFAPVKIGEFTVSLTVDFDDKKKDGDYSDIAYSFRILRKTAKNPFPNYYDTIMTKFNKVLFARFRDYFLNKEGFTYSMVSPQNGINDEGNREVILEKDGRQLSLEEKEYGIFCLIRTYVR